MIKKLQEGLGRGDLKRLVGDEIHIDEFKSKMGDDADVVVISFKVIDKEPAIDLVNFIEKSYDWVLDADASAGEMDDGDYLVFVEVSRTPEIANQIIQMVKDVVNLTEIEFDEWNFFYRKNGKVLPLTKDLLLKIPQTPEQYIARFGDDSDPLEKMQEAARVPMKNKKAVVNEFTEQLRVAAGLK